MKITLTSAWIHNHPPLFSLSCCGVYRRDLSVCLSFFMMHSRVYLDFRSRDSGSLMSAVPLKYDTDTIFSDKQHCGFKWKSLSGCPSILSTSVCTFCQFDPSILDLSAFLACLCWPALPCQVISLCFLLLLQFSHHSYSDFARRTLTAHLGLENQTFTQSNPHVYMLSYERNDQQLGD